MKTKGRPLITLCGLLLLAAAAQAQPFADTIYTGGTILTMDDSLPGPEAVAVKDGRILKVGSLASLAAHRGEATRVFDLEGRALLPGFVDSHGHVVMGGLQALSANLLAPPDGTVTDIAGIQQTLRTWADKNAKAVAAGSLILGFGYDESQLEEKRPPNRHDLDAVSADLPVIVVHQSGHFGVANSKALSLAGITAASKNPPGGVIRRDPAGEPDGVLEENAFFTALTPLLGNLGPDGFKAFARAGAELWARFGYTTAPRYGGHHEKRGRGGWLRH